MTCDQIKAEMVQQPGGAVSTEHAEAAGAAAQEYMAQAKKVQGEATAMIAGQVATSMAAGAIAGLVPGGGLVAGAIDKANEAQQAAFSARIAAELRPAQERMMAANAQSMGDLAQRMQENPRFGRLLLLAQQRHCRDAGPYSSAPPPP
jgi:hypothetical protein